MVPRDPRTQLRTHEVTNQAPPLVGYDVADDPALLGALKTFGAGWAIDEVRSFGREIGRDDVLELARQANRFPPELKLFDRYGQRIDEVDFHPAYHALMTIAMRGQIHARGWRDAKPGAQVVRTALAYLMNQIESGVCCPMAMTCAIVPALRNEPALAKIWEPRFTATDYDGRAIPANEKSACTAGMAMTEKQGGSDVRANTTRAEPLDAARNEFRLTGHKWFCSAPMSDAFLTLAYTDAGLTCFFVPRWTPDGARNAIQLQRLKDKLGNKSNASSEIEYDGAWAQRVGPEGRGVATIIDMVQQTRLDCVLGSAGLIRQATLQAAHHARHRSAFQKRLIDQPAMRAVLADLTLEAEAATWLALRLGAALEDPNQRAFARVATAIGKYWVCKRAPHAVYEAMECLGGAGYVEETVLPRLYREAPVNSIWEGSGNVIALDVLRAFAREPESVAALRAELDTARGGDAAYDAALDATLAALGNKDDVERRARYLTERLAVLLQASLLLRHAPRAIADAFVAWRLREPAATFGAAAPAIDLDAVLGRMPSP
ncbi:acyl-CoA dehydrogenase family protein [Roseiterribacter gracilis]|uniref:Acyl-CoA dehydrogenase n=1 Tax=Roseiterribacter gracilis TaxID=2812848 RepID=A0A8S8XFQ9_9PROT|nr:acyl-CoA dehydrogenase [Rhodospirillales bacterium TMPK1]